MMEAIKRQVLTFEMPGTGIPDFAQHAKQSPEPGSTTWASTTTPSSGRSSSAIGT